MAWPRRIGIRPRSTVGPAVALALTAAAFAVALTAAAEQPGLRPGAVAAAGPGGRRRGGPARSSPAQQTSLRDAVTSGAQPGWPSFRDGRRPGSAPAQARIARLARGDSR